MVSVVRAASRPTDARRGNSGAAAAAAFSFGDPAAKLRPVAGL